MIIEAIETINVLKTFTDTLKNIKEILPKDGEDKSKEELEAYKLVEEAALETKRYLYDLKQGEKVSRKVEKIISDKWKTAGDAIDRYSNVLFKITQVKKMGWVEHNWSEIENNAATINLDTIIGICNRKIDTLK